jgi:hypothetical protein
VQAISPNGSFIFCSVNKQTKKKKKKEKKEKRKGSVMLASNYTYQYELY